LAGGSRVCHHSHYDPFVLKFLSLSKLHQQLLRLATCLHASPALRIQAAEEVVV
jgi:hypothetical protein